MQYQISLKHKIVHNIKPTKVNILTFICLTGKSNALVNVTSESKFHFDCSSFMLFEDYVIKGNIITW